MGVQPVHVGVDPGGELRRDALRVLGVARPLDVHVAAVQEQAGGSVLRHVVGPQYVGELAESASAPQVDLEEALAGGVEALREEHVVLVVGVDVGYAVAVLDQLDRRPQARHPVVARPGRCRARRCCAHDICHHTNSRHADCRCRQYLPSGEPPLPRIRHHNLLVGQQIPDTNGSRLGGSGTQDEGRVVSFILTAGGRRGRRSY